MVSANKIVNKLWRRRNSGSSTVESILRAVAQGCGSILAMAHHSNFARNDLPWSRLKSICALSLGFLPNIYSLLITDYDEKQSTAAAAAAAAAVITERSWTLRQSAPLSP